MTKAGTQDEFWSCPNCTLDNSVSLSACDACNCARTTSKHSSRRRAKKNKKKAASKINNGDKTELASKSKEHVPSTISNGGHLVEGDSWTCIQCTTVNSPRLLECEVCYESRFRQLSLTESTSSPHEEFWRCPNCTLDNSVSLSVCDACNYARKTFKHACQRRSKKNNKKATSIINNGDNTKLASKPNEHVPSTVTSASGLNEVISSPCNLWQCPLCMFTNWKTTVVCEMCKNFRNNLLEQPEPLRQAEIIDLHWQYIAFNCRLQKKLYTDESFPPAASSLYYSSRSENNETVKWLRLRNVVVDECDKHLSWTLVRSLVDPSDVYQGNLGNCWFLSALGVLAERTDLVRAILLTDRLCSHGIYQIRLCKDGNWMSVLVDDFVPCDTDGTLLYAQVIRKQLWVPLVEKAMAKINGCYEALTTGRIIEGLNTLTGAPCECIPLQLCSNFSTTIDTNLIWAQLVSSWQAAFLMGTACGGSAIKIAKTEFEKLGLDTFHIYSILDVREISGNRLLQLRNPNGDISWTGDWSNSSYNWTSDLRNELMPNGPADEVFWICFSDLLKYFNSVGICKVRYGWHEARFSGILPPFSLQEDLSCVFLTITEPTEVDFMLYQDNHRHMESSKRSLLDLCLVVFKATDDGSSETYNLIGYSKREVQGFVGYYKMFEPGTYIAIPLAFNHWHTKFKDISAYPKYVLAVHSSKKIPIKQVTTPPETIRHAIISIAIIHGKYDKIVDNVHVYFCRTNFSGSIIMVENRNKNKWVYFTCDIEECWNIVSTRGTLKTIDLIPPLHRQVIAVVTHDRGSQGFRVNQQVNYMLVDESELSDWKDSNTSATCEAKDSGELHKPSFIDW